MLKNKILNFLKDFSTEPFDINSLLVSSYIVVNNIDVTKNILIKKYLISSSNPNYPKLFEFIELVKLENQNLSLEDLILLFEFVISPSDKMVNGAVYTPKYIREFIILNSINDRANIDDATACDVACGCGGFLYEFALKLNDKSNKPFIQIIEENLYGIDIQAYSIERTKILLSLLALSNGEDVKKINFNLFIGDSLEFDWFEKSLKISECNGFDYVFSNPPYVSSSNLDENTKSLMKNWSVASTGKLDLYIPFFEIGLKWLNEGGILGYITVNNFYRSLNGRALRKYFSESSFKFSLIDFGNEQVFKSRLTYTCICQIEKSEGLLSYTYSSPNKINSLKESDFVDFKYSDLNDFDGWHLDNIKVQLNLKRLEGSGKSLGELFDIRNGFATLRNKIYVFKPIDEDDEYYYFEKDSKSYRVERTICRDTIKANILKTETDLVEFNEKLIFPYTLTDEQSNDLFIEQLNRSVNIIPEKIFEEDYPMACNYLNDYREELGKRDKGQRNYETWYAFGRSQALNVIGLKLLFPYMSDNPYFVYTENRDLLFYNGYALVSNSEEALKFVQKILMSDVFWYYIKHTSKPYSSNYYALAKNYIKNFSIPAFTVSEKNYFMRLKRKSSINKYLLNKYNITDIDLK
ncbi:class I SAM-dependent DNA methyltransferase [Winogradskyella sp. MIT101101]|uniref:class I SAM-dependent DNA methyltransferase n=1 Tax=Winogradskyella sp. MIT101101 TaxID=3098297 RepID=UPI00399B2042